MPQKNQLRKNASMLPIVVLILCVFAVTTGEFIIVGILPQVAADVHVSISTAGLLVTAYAVGMIFGGPILTALTARCARKPLIIALLFVAFVGNLASALAVDYPSLFIARVVTALVTSTFFANAIVIATSMVPPQKKASAIAKLAFGMNVAMILGVPLGTWIGNATTWRITFVAIAGLCLIGLLLALHFIPNVAGSTQKGSAIGELKVLKNRSVQLAITLTALGNAGVLAVFTFMAPLLTGVSGFKPELVAGLLLVYGAGATIGNIAGGRLADKSLARSQVVLLATLIISLLSLWFISSNQILTAIMIFVLGAVSFSVIPGMQMRVLLAATAAPTLAIAVNASAYQLSAAFAGWYGGIVVNEIGLHAIYLVAALVTCLGLLLSLYLLRHNRDD